MITTGELIQLLKEMVLESAARTIYSAESIAILQHKRDHEREALVAEWLAENRNFQKAKGMLADLKIPLPTTIKSSNDFFYKI